MASKGKQESSIEKHEIEGHNVEIRRREEQNDELWINGVRQKYFMTKDGYNLHADAYARPQKSLLDAVKTYLRTYGKKGA